MTSVHTVTVMVGMNSVLSVTFLLLLVTSLLGFSRCDEDDDSGHVPVTSTCYWPKQFQARLGRWSGTDAGGTPDVFHEEMVLYFNYAYRRWGFWIREYFVTNDYMEIIYVEDYKEGTATVAAPGGCARLPLPPDSRMLRPRVPENARFVETLWLGGNRTLPYDVWEWTEDEFVSGKVDVSAKISISVSHDDCKPLSEIGWWTAQNFNYTSYIGFMDLHYGETDGRTNDPFADIRKYYNCKDYDEMPKEIDVRWDIHPDEIYLLNRIHASPSSPPDRPPNIH